MTKIGPRPPHFWGFYITQNLTLTPGWTNLKERSAATYTTGNKHKRRTSTPSSGFEQAIPAMKWLEIYVLHRTACKTHTHTHTHSLSLSLSLSSSLSLAYFNVHCSVYTYVKPRILWIAVIFSHKAVGELWLNQQLNNIDVWQPTVLFSNSIHKVDNSLNTCKFYSV
jgi:hypothetical protein